MFVLGDEEADKEVFALRPMTCPFQYQAYLKDVYKRQVFPFGETDWGFAPNPNKILIKAKPLSKL